MKVAAKAAPAEQEQCMRIALNMAERGMAAGGPPVGACLVHNGGVIARAHNSVISELDATAHAELVTIRIACRELRRLELADCDLYVTVEPCPMCLAASHYAGIRAIYFGATLSEMQAITGNELELAADRLFANQSNAPAVIGDVLHDECYRLLQSWSGRAGVQS